MSRAFVKEDGGYVPPGRYPLPPRGTRGYDAAAARALLEGARDAATESAEAATGYRWGEPRLAKHVRALLAEAEREGDDRLEQLARRFLR